MSKRRWLILPMAGLLLGSPARAERSVEADVVLGAALKMRVEASGCSNKGGPYISLDGDLFSGGLRGKLRAQNASGVHSDEVDAVLSASLTDPTGKTIT